MAPARADPRVLQRQPGPGRGLHMTPVIDAVVRGSGPLRYHVDGEPNVGDDDLQVLHAASGSVCRFA